MEPTRRHWLVAGAAALAGAAARPLAFASGPSVSPKAESQPPLPGGRVIRVGQGGDAVAVSAAAAIARDGDVVEIEAGEYRGDVAVWLQKRLTIRAAGGPVRMIADGRHAEGKGIWVLRNGDFDISGIDFEGARVPDRNGAGIRFERGRLRLSDCRFFDNENGLLAGNDQSSELFIDRCQFSGMLTRPSSGHYHNLYVGTIARFAVSASYFSRAQVGHLLKTRARESSVLYNRLTDEDGCASYELEFPNGGQVLALGNLIVQEAATEHVRIVAYGAEGYRWPRNRLLMAHNTVVNRRTAGATFVQVFSGSASGLLCNNLFVGRGGCVGVHCARADGNTLRADERIFANPENFDFHVKGDAELKGSGKPVPPVDGVSILPTHEYLHPMRLRRLDPVLPLSPGAFQF